MQLIIGSGTVPQASRDIMPTTGTPGWATDGNPALNIEATDDLACHYNMMMAEIIQPILDAGLELDATNWGQLSAAIKALIAKGVTGLISGTAGVVATNGDAPGAGLHLNGSTGNPSFLYEDGEVDLARYASYIAAPTLYASSTSITIPAGVTRAFIKIVGGGGSGCSCEGTNLQSSTYGAGGGAGGYLYFWIPVKKGDVIGITIGAGATSPTQTVTGQTNGGQTSVTLNGTQVAWAGGGTGGVWNTVSSSAGGTGGGASTLSGATPIEYSNGSSGGDGQTGAQSISSVTGYGGAGPWGGSGRAGNGGGIAGSGFGAGGGGAYDTSGSNNFYAGGAGHGGCATVEMR